MSNTAYGQTECGACGVRFESTYKSWPCCPNCMTPDIAAARNAVRDEQGRAVAAYARSERLAVLLARCRKAMWGKEYWASPLRDEVDAALAQQPPPTGGHGAAT